MLKTKITLILVGALLGGLAGVSFLVSILPYANAAMGFTDYFTVRLALSNLTAAGFALWAVGGGNAVRFGTAKRGALWLGGIGLLTGLLVTFFYLTRNPTAVVANTLIGLGYGVGAGLLIGSLFRKK